MMVPHSVNAERDGKATKVVIALGGNALMEAGTPPTAEEQLKVVKKTCSSRKSRRRSSPTSFPPFPSTAAAR